RPSTLPPTRGATVRAFFISTGRFNSCQRRRGSLGSTPLVNGIISTDWGEVAMNRTVLSLALVAAMVAGFAVNGRAGQVGQCIKAATGDFKDCKTGCKDDFQTAKDACINKDHDCVDACREGRAECVDATGFEAAIRACNAEAQVEIANCKHIFPPDSDAL